jgi:hypothetical protein
VSVGIQRAESVQRSADLLAVDDAGRSSRCTDGKLDIINNIQEAVGPDPSGLYDLITCYKYHVYGTISVCKEL